MEEVSLANISAVIPIKEQIPLDCFTKTEFQILAFTKSRYYKFYPIFVIQTRCSQVLKDRVAY